MDLQLAFTSSNYTHTLGSIEGQNDGTKSLSE